MPLPEAWGENCRTNQAANRVATAHAPTTIRNPQIVWPWAQVIVVSRRRSACTSKSRKIAPTHPVAAPTIKAVAARLNRLRRSSPVCRWSSLVHGWFVGHFVDDP